MIDADEVARRCADAMYAADPSSRHLGIEITDVAAGRARARMTVAATMVNGHGIAHGGYVFLLADTAFAFACNTYEVVTVAAAAEVVFVTPARAGDALVAEATERALYGRSGIYDVTVRRSDGELIAEFRGHSRRLGTREAPPS
jgi:acyl-CoA thioesterase